MARAAVSPKTGNGDVGPGLTGSSVTRRIQGAALRAMQHLIHRSHPPLAGSAYGRRPDISMLHVSDSPRHPKKGPVCRY